MRDTVVLDYALPPNAVLSKRRRYAVLRHTLLLFLGAALGGMFGRALSPVTYRGTALYSAPISIRRIRRSAALRHRRGASCRTLV